MKINIKLLSLFFIILAFAFSLAIIPASNCHATSIKPINIKQIFDPPPEPYIDDGEPGPDPYRKVDYLTNTRKRDHIIYNNYRIQLINNQSIQCFNYKYFISLYLVTILRNW